MNLNKLNILLDSTVFRNSKFLFWLRRNKQHFNINISIIVALETYHWYNLRGIPKETFDKLLKSLNANMINLVENQLYDISNNVLKSQLRFKHHSRDIIIATHSILNNASVITDNVKHFTWMEKDPLLPEDLVSMIISSEDHKNSI